MTYVTKCEGYMDCGSEWSAEATWGGLLFRAGGCNTELGAIRACRRKIRKYQRYAPQQ
jgi:hypothetical protein